MTNLQSLLQSPENYAEFYTDEKKDQIPVSEDSENLQNNIFSFTNKKETNNYLRSNLAQLTPENNVYSNYHIQSPLNYDSFAAQFTTNSMPKTQETNWIRPDAQSELAAAMPTLAHNQREQTSVISPYVALKQTAPIYQAEKSSLPSELNTGEINDGSFPSIVSKSQIPVLSSNPSFQRKSVISKKEFIPTTKQNSDMSKFAF